MEFPIASIEENIIHLPDNGCTYLYEVLPPDLEQKEAIAVDYFYGVFHDWLVNLPSGSFVRMFLFENRIFLNTDLATIEIPECRIVPAKDFVSLFFGMDNLYNHPAIIGSDTLTCNQQNLKMVNLYNMPPSPIPCELMQYGDFVVNFKKVDPLKAKSGLQIKRKMHFSGLQKNIRDIESEASFTESESLLENIIRGQDALFDVEAWIIVRDRDLEKLCKRTEEILKKMEIKNYKGLIETVGLSTFWANNFFFCPPTFKRAHPVNGIYLKNILPLTADHIDEQGIALTSRAEREVFINLASKAADNNNVLVSGRSGSGKSFLINKVIHEELKNGAKAVILDYNSSFYRNTLYHGGNCFAESFNPMQFSDPAYLKALVLSMVDKKDFDLKAEGRLYAKIKEIMDEYTYLPFRKFIEKLSEEFPGITDYFEEFWECFTDQEFCNSKITFVDLSRYPDRVLPALIIFLIELFKSMDGRRIFVFEECWHILAKASDFVVQFFRTFRKEGATAIAISQSLEDFIKSDMGRTVAENSYHKFLFRQDIRTSPFINEFDVAQIQSLGGEKNIFSEFYYKTERHKKCLRYFGTPLEYVLFNTTKEESDAINNYISDYSDKFEFKKIIHSFLAVEYAPAP